MSAIASEIAQCEDKIRNLEKTAEKVRFDLAVEQAVLARLRAVNEGASTGNGGAPMRSAGSLASRIEEFMIHSGGPVTVAAITESLEKAGVTSKSRDGLKPSVASALSRRSDLFVNVGKAEYDLVARQKGVQAMSQSEEHG